MHFETTSLKSAQSSNTSYKGSIFSEEGKASDNTVLYSELRLIERNEGEINVCWKGAHMMLFFMAFVFGALCTCCFHRLMYMFNEKCVLFPKLVSHYSIHRIVYEFFSYKPLMTDDENKGSTDYVTTQWAENSVCYLPTYVPLVSGLAGLVWTTMFLMCSSGTSNVTGAQRHWRALPVMFLFSVAMSILCIYASAVTHSGLRELCLKMEEATGRSSSTYKINVATLVYERRIHGVYQATLLSIMSAWLHTGCWVLSTLLIGARVLLAVDFTLVHVKAQLIGNLDDILQKHEQQIDSFNAESATPLRFDIDEDDSEVELFTTTDVIKNVNKTPLNAPKEPIETSQLTQSPTSLGPEGRQRQKLLNKYIQRILHDLLQTVGKRNKNTQTITRLDTNTPEILTDTTSAELLTKEFIQKLRGKLTQEINDFENQIKSYLKNKDDNEDTEGDFQKINNDGKTYKRYKDLKNKLNNINYGEIEQKDKISSREIYDINLEGSPSEKSVKTEEKYTDMSREIFNYQYHMKSYDDFKITKKIKNIAKDENEHEIKDDNTKLKDIEKKERVHEREQLSGNPDDDNIRHDETDKNQKKEEKR